MISQTVSHYRILQKIGAGGMGEVFLAEDTKLERKVALKFLPAQFSADEEERKRFVHEAKAAAALNHPNIVTVHEIGEHEGQVFIAMEYVEGKTLKEIISGNLTPSTLRLMPIPQVLDMAIQISSGLAAAHAKGIVHRDLKPANIMLTDEGTAKIVDFGLAKLKGMSRLTKSGTTLGTVAYMSPEQALGKDVDQRSDIWSLGVILYEMLAGVLPFKGEYDQAVLYAVINEEPESLSKLVSYIPCELERIVHRSLSKDPIKRYPAADELLNDMKRSLQALVAPESVQFSLRHFLLRPKIIVPTAIALCAITIVAFMHLKHQARIRWAERDLLPRVAQLIDTGFEYYSRAYNLARQAKKYLPHHPLLNELLERISVNTSIRTDPPGARVFIQNYQEPASEWEFVGVSPIETIRLPVAFIRLKMEKERYATVLGSAVTYAYSSKYSSGFAPSPIIRKLDREDSIPTGMVRVTGEDGLGDFFIDRYEVTNRQFLGFVQNGGYQKKEFWKQKFTSNGRPLTWEEVIIKFLDQTGIPGPAGWQAGTYPKGEDDFPVSGVSWYEAAAYAEYAGKSLPTWRHWGEAAGGFSTQVNMGSYFLLGSQSNFNGDGPAVAGRHTGITPCGAFDMAGNVREWCWNESPLGKVVRGGAWNDSPYLFRDLSQASPFDRSLRNGFRCALFPDPGKIPYLAFKSIKVSEAPDLYKMKPVPNAVYQIYKEQFSYDQTDLHARLEWRNEGDKEWIQEKITFDAAYEKERLIAYLFLPKNSHPPYQAVVYFPGSDSNERPSSQDMEHYWEFEENLFFLPANGRAVLYPVYKGTFERREPDLGWANHGSYRSVEWKIKMVKDFRRCVDYLESRPDIDGTRIAYLGYSWGSAMGVLITAVEGRLRASVLQVGYLSTNELPECNAINYVSRVKVPTLMFNGRYDLSLSYLSEVKPLFDLMGTPKQHKLLRLYNTDHFIPRIEYIKETVQWLDKYLGPVKR